MESEAERLRKRAKWYRDFADIGSADNRASRLALAAHFERLAAEADAKDAREREARRAALVSAVSHGN